MKDKLLIIGASGHGRVVADIALSLGKWENISFLDDDIDLKHSMGLDVVGSSKDIFKFLDQAEFFVAIGNNSIRERIQKELIGKGAAIATIIDDSAILGRELSVGLGTVIMPGVIINCCTTIGEGCIINTAATIDHDNSIGNFVHISPGVHIAGTVNIGNRTWLGIGSIVSNNISIGEDIMVGAGGVIVRDIDISGTYLGVPVRRI